MKLNTFLVKSWAAGERCSHVVMLGAAASTKSRFLLLPFPGIKCRLAQAVLAHNLGYGLAAGLLLQNGHNLGLTEMPSFIRQSSGSESYVFLYSRMAFFLGKRTQFLYRHFCQFGSPGLLQTTGLARLNPFGETHLLLLSNGRQDGDEGFLKDAGAVEVLFGEGLKRDTSSVLAQEVVESLIHFFAVEAVMAP